ncbi:MAG: MerC domain-containing protein, partial [Gammaproteobacteria bacterium]|nr:MerC domain-containing protein [Gammaproteobacteria bacterium]
MCARSVSREFRDKIAVSLSMFCVLQCIFMPFLVTLLPFLDFWWLSDEM